MVNGFKLRQWLMRQKRYAEKGGSTKIKPEQIEKLRSIGLFDELTGTEKTWFKHYEQAKKYYAEHGDLKIPNDYLDDGFQLGIWLVMQKQRKRKGELEKDKIDLLDELNIEWENMSEKANAQLYENGFQRLEQFIAEQGLDKIKAQTICDDGYALGRWVYGHMRTLNKREKI